MKYTSYLKKIGKLPGQSALLMIAGMLFAFSSLFGQALVEGELKMWHKITLTFDGPNTNETADPNPFMNYRLNVTFTNGSKSYTVPGYFAADGDAAITSASRGD